MKNQNILTGHFFVISSMTIDENGNINFGYYDNASSKKGKSDNNQLKMDTTTGTLTDETEIPVGGVSKYTVSEVRTNK